MPDAMTFAGFSDMDACRLHYADDDSVDNPRKFCKWLKQNSDKVDDAEQILLDVDVDYVSAVDTPAQDSQWVAVKEEDGEDRLEATGDLIVKSDDDEQRKAYAAVLVADDVDKQKDVVPDFVVRDAAHNFMKKLAEWQENAEVDSDHDNRGGKGTPVESWTLKESKEYETVDGGTKDYPAGTWMMEVEFNDDQTWKRVKSGDLSGWSIEGPAIAEPTRKSANTQNDSIMSNDDIEALQGDVQDVTESVDQLTEEISKMVDAQEQEETEEVEKEADDADAPTEEEMREVAKEVAEDVLAELEDDDEEDVQKEVDRKVSEEDVEKEEPEDAPDEIDYDNIEL